MESYEISVLYGTQDREQFFHKWFETKKHKTFGCIQAQMQTLKFKVRVESSSWDSQTQVHEPSQKWDVILSKR